MQYTCIKVNDKYVVMPLYAPVMLGRETERALANALPTLVEHQSYWATMESKVFGEEVFTKHPEYKIFSDFAGKHNTTWDTVAYAIPKQQEQYLWEEADAKSKYFADSFGNMPVSEPEAFEINNWWKSRFEYLKQHYTLQKNTLTT